MRHCGGYEILLLLGGEINLYTEYGGTHMKPGDLVCIPAYEFHRAELLTEGQYDRIVINILDTELPAKCTEQTNLEECFLRPPGTMPEIVKDTIDYVDTSFALEISMISFCGTLSKDMSGMAARYLFIIALLISAYR